MELDAMALERDRASRVPCNRTGGVKADAGIGSAHGFVHGASAMQKMSIRGEKANWAKQRPANSQAKG